MTEQAESLGSEPPEAPLSRRNLRLGAGRRRGAEPDEKHPVRPGQPRRARTVARSLRTFTVLTVVCGLTTTFALPTYAVSPMNVEAQTIQQVASEETQSLVVASEVSVAPLARGSYSATTPEEIQQAKADEAAAARARVNAQLSSARFEYSMVAPGNGIARWPLGGPFTVGDGFGARGGAHMGTDMLAAGGTPVFAAVDGVVRISQDSYSAYGVTVILESMVNGQRLRTVYPHMRTGSRQVSVGQVVSAGEQIGSVGSTGRSTANHLHFEVYVDGTALDSLAWLQTNAG